MPEIRQTTSPVFSVQEIYETLNGKGCFPCTVPWTRLEERELGGDFWFCCWIQKDLGTVRKNSPTSFLPLWNEEKARKIRDSYLKKDFFRYCPKDCVGFENNAMGFYDYSQEEFETFSDRFKENLFNVVAAVREKKEVIDAKPIRLKLHPTSICNLRCPMCNVHSAMPEEVGEAYKQTIDELIPYLNDLNVFGGEPFFCKLSREIIFGETVRKNPQVHISTVTNGTMVHQKLLDQLSELRLGQFIFSVDSLSPEAFPQIRLGAKYENVMENMERFIRYRDEGRLRVRQIGLSCSIQKLNHEEIPRIVEYCHERNIDVQFSLIFGTSELYGLIPAVSESVKKGITKAEELHEDKIAHRLESILYQLPGYEKRLKQLRFTDRLLNMLGKHRVMLFFQKHQGFKRFVKKILRLE